MTNENHNVFEFDDVRVEPSKFKIWKAGAELALEPKTFQVLLFLLENRGRLIEKNELLDAVWKDTFVTENAMTREIAKLRKALGDDSKTPKYIQTVHTQGYRFIAEVTETDGAIQNESPIVPTANLPSDKSTATAQDFLPITETGKKAAPKNRRSFALKSAALLGALALIVVGAWLIRNRQQSFAYIGVQKVAQITNWSGLDDFPALSPDGNTVAYCSDHNGGFEIYVKQLTPGANEIQLTSDGGQNFQPAWSPDGQRIAYYSKLRGGIWIIPASGGEARQITDFGSHPAWSPDGKQIAFQSNPIVDLGANARNALPPSTLWVVGANGGEPKQLTQIGNPAGGHGSPSFAPDGKRIVFEVDDYNSASVWTISAGGDDAKEITQTRTRGNYEPVYAPDGKSILYTSGIAFQVRVNPDTNEPVGEPSQIAGIGATSLAVRRVSFSADGKRIAYSTLMRRESLSSVRLQTNSSEADGAPVPIVQNTNARNSFPTFSPDGKRIAFMSCRNMSAIACNIWLVNADGSNQIQLTTGESSDLIPSWFPDMEQVAYISKLAGHSTLWAINLNTKRDKMLLDLTDDIEYARLSPDGKQIVFNFKRNGGIINVWTASLAGGEPKQLTFDKELAGFPAWSPDGKYIAFQMKRGDDTHVMVMPNEGGTPEQLTFDKGNSWVYDWSSDGDKILFAGQRDGIWNVRWVSRSTKKQQQLTDYTKLNSFVRYPAWSPLGNQVIYEYSETTGNIWIADLK
ncbi:MAG: PD40 domain-containing protein [Acidobacteria bacterium]|jgi:Tol biopolymer transport system component/DNA-binding winged helix-turn-helix (wHTH) protein|nr:PD40 domain-containing protein [Acidobacteriota bacterium]